MRREDPPTTITPPVQITEAAWHQALNMLPPVGWSNDAYGESFKLVGRHTGSAAFIYVRINARHFQFTDDIRTAHAECCRMVARSEAWRDGLEYPAELGEPIAPGRAFAMEDREGGR